MIIYLAAMEVPEHAAALVKAQYPDVLFSYYSAVGVKNNMKPFLATGLQAPHVRNRFCDSGAFSFRRSLVAGHASGHQGVKEDLQKIEDYLQRYMAYVKMMRRRGLIDWWCEVDLAPLLPYEWLVWQRRQWIKQGLGDGLIQVWHSDMNLDDWKWLVREAASPGRSGYVAIEGRQAWRRDLNYTRFLKFAYDRGVRVHGFMLTHAQQLLTHPFYSTDSTSWIHGPKHGAPPAHQRLGGVIQVRPDSLKRRPYRMKGITPYFMIRTIPTGMSKSQRVQYLSGAAGLWKRQTDRLDRLWKARGVDWEAAINNPRIREEIDDPRPPCYRRAVSQGKLSARS